MEEKLLYERLGGYDGITAFINDLLSRLQADSQLGRFWKNRGKDGLSKEKQLLIDFLCSVTGGLTHYSGRDMKTSHQGMNISDSDWSVFLGHAGSTMAFLQIPKQECDEIVAFISDLKGDVVEA